MNSLWTKSLALFAVLFALTSCGGSVEFKGKGASSGIERPASDDVVKITPTPKSDNVTSSNTPSDFVIGATPLEDPLSQPTPQVFVPSWGNLQLYSTVDQFEFVESSAQAWMSSFVADHSDSTYLTSVLNVLSFVNAER